MLLGGKDQPCTEASSSTAINDTPEPAQEVNEILDFHHITSHEDNCEPPVSISPSKISVSTQTDNFLMTSSPMKSIGPATLFAISETSLTTNETKDSTLDETMNETEYNPSESSFEEKDVDVINDEKFVVYEGMLDILFNFVCCPSCHSRAKNITKSKMGTSLHCKIVCESKHLILEWKSQPLIGKLPAFNLLISASIFFAGSTYETFRKPVEYAGLGFVNSNTFYNIQRTLIIPMVNKQFNKDIEIARAEAKTVDPVLLGDGRFDSPGKSAKYCTYTCQSPFTKKIIASSTVQTLKGKGSSPLELTSFKNCLDDLEADGFEISVVATDRNRQLAKWLRDEKPSVKHKFDPWHFSKNIKSKLRPLSKRKGCKELQEWIKPIGNHLFWCADNCKGDPDLLREMWKSQLHHITNKHTFPSKYEKYKKCAHKKFSKEKVKRTKWIKKSSVAYDAIEKVVLDKRNLKDMEQLTEPFHTGSLEIFHSLLNSYASKRYEFELNVMDARVKLAVLDHNCNVNREQAVVSKEHKGSQKKGSAQWKYVSSRLSKDWVAKERKVAKSTTFVSSLLLEVVNLKAKGEDTTKKVTEIENRLTSPKNIAYTERPNKSLILAKHVSTKRFKK